MLEVLWQDDHYVVINKPGGSLVHRTSIAADVNEGFLLQRLRDQLGYRLYPVHRLDRPTSGVLLFAKTPHSASLIKKLFDQKRIQKTYLAITRGHFSSGIQSVNIPLRKLGSETLQEAETHFKPLAYCEVPIQTDRYPTSRFSLVQCTPITGRTHQIRRHLARVNHPIIGDHKHGDNKQNRYFELHHNIHGLLLHSYALSFDHPISQESIFIRAIESAEMRLTLDLFDWVFIKKEG